MAFRAKIAETKALVANSSLVYQLAKAIEVSGHRRARACQPVPQDRFRDFEYLSTLLIIEAEQLAQQQSRPFFGVERAGDTCQTEGNVLSYVKYITRI